MISSLLLYYNSTCHCIIIYFTCNIYHIYLIYITDLEADKEATRLLTVNAENLMTAVGVVLNTTESALIKVPPEDRAHLTGLSWIKKY